MLTLKLSPPHSLPRLCNPGGSAANVLSTLAQLGAGQASVALVGCLGADTTGAAYRASLARAGVSAAGLVMTSSSASSAVAVTLVTSDGERTMRTWLGAASELKEHHVTGGPASGLVRSAQLFHSEGYALRHSTTVLAAVRTAASGGAVVSLDLGSSDCVRDCLPALKAVLATGAVDLVFCNEDEASMLGQLTAGEFQPPGAQQQLSPVDAGIAFLLRFVAAVSMTRGAMGSVTTRKDGDRFATPAVPVPQVVDTTGAGDAHAAGFLWALLHGAPLPVCAAAGAAAAAEAVVVRGAQLPPFAIARLRDSIAGAGVAVTHAAQATGAPPPGLLSSLTDWLWPNAADVKDDSPEGAIQRLPQRTRTEAGLSRIETAGQKSTGQLWGGDIDYSIQEEGEGGAVVETMDERGQVVLMRRTLSGRLLPVEHPGSYTAPYSDGMKHRRLSSRVFDPKKASSGSMVSAGGQSSGDLIAASIQGVCGPTPGPNAGVASYVAWYLGLGWLSAWVDSQSLFATPQEAPNRMRRSMSSRVMSGRSVA
jgi:sugar/nucleoside kinase (ribokinase family)